MTSDTASIAATNILAYRSIQAILALSPVMRLGTPTRQMLSPPS